LDFETAFKKYDRLIKAAAYRYTMRGNVMLEFDDMYQTGLKELHRAILKYGDKDELEFGKLFKTLLWHGMFTKVSKWKLSASKYAQTIELTESISTADSLDPLYDESKLIEIVNHVESFLSSSLESNVFRRLLFSSEQASFLAWNEAIREHSNSCIPNARHFASELQISEKVFRRTVGRIKWQILLSGVLPKKVNMSWFGKAWNPMVCVPKEEIPVPVGQKCLWCKEEITKGDRGFVIRGSDKPQHYACFMRSVVGSVGHQNEKCTCHGGDEDDPPGMSTRQAAEAAVKLYEQRTKVRNTRSKSRSKL
jgi:hypothetical protein